MKFQYVVYKWLGITAISYFSMTDPNKNFFCSFSSLMLVLYETAAGYALFKLLGDELANADDIYKDFETPEKANKKY
jgi:hypothetical protein